MLEFVFFHHHIFRLFTEFIRQRHIAYRSDDDGDTITVSISEDEDEAVIEQLEQEYDRLLDLSRDQTDRDEGVHSGNYQKASLLIRLRNGDISYAHVDTGLVNRLLQVMTTTELNSFIESVADAVENPDARSFCQRIEDTDANIG